MVPPAVLTHLDVIMVSVCLWLTDVTPTMTVEMHRMKLTVTISVRTFICNNISRKSVFYMLASIIVDQLIDIPTAYYCPYLRTET